MGASLVSPEGSTAAKRGRASRALSIVGGDASKLAALGRKYVFQGAGRGGPWSFRDPASTPPNAKANPAGHMAVLLASARDPGPLGTLVAPFRGGLLYTSGVKCGVLVGGTPGAVSGK
jgi:hypothetical protein